MSKDSTHTLRNRLQGAADAYAQTSTRGAQEALHDAAIAWAARQRNPGRTPLIDSTRAADALARARVELGREPTLAELQEALGCGARAARTACEAAGWSPARGPAPTISDAAWLAAWRSLVERVGVAVAPSRLAQEVGEGAHPKAARRAITRLAKAGKIAPGDEIATVRAWILDVLADGGARKTSEIIAMVSVRRGVALEMLAAMVADGTIQQLGNASSTAYKRRDQPKSGPLELRVVAPAFADDFG